MLSHDVWYCINVVWTDLGNAAAVAVVVVGIVVAALLLYYLIDVLILLFLGVVAAAALEPWHTRPCRLGLPKWLAVLLIGFVAQFPDVSPVVIIRHV